MSRVWATTVQVEMDTNVQEGCTHWWPCVCDQGHVQLSPVTIPRASMKCGRNMRPQCPMGVGTAEKIGPGLAWPGLSFLAHT